MNHRLLSFICLLFAASLAQAQTMSFPQEGNADCNDPVEIKDSLYGPTVPAEGYGKQLDIETNNMKDPYLFEREHNTLWYRFEALYTADLAMDIIAVDTMDDFDFIIFEYDGSNNFCKKIKDGKMKPIRSNMAKNKPSSTEHTGMCFVAVEDFVPSGPGDPHSRALEAIQGDVYYLVVDNFSNNGKGHTIHMHYKGYPKKRGSLSIAVRDLKYRKRIKADVEILELPVSDRRGDKLDYYLTGNLSYNVELEPERSYEVNCSAIGYFFHSEIVTTPAKPKDLRIRVKLSQVNLGEKLTLKDIEFVGDAAELKPKSMTTLNHLVGFMKKNTGISVEIQGHVNASGNANKKLVKSLSEARAKSVYNYLVKRGVDIGRLTYKGYGNKQMVFKRPANEKQEAANRRVDVLVTSIE